MAKKLDLHSINYKQLNAVAAGTVAAGSLVTLAETNGFTLVDTVLNDPYALVTEAEMVKAEKTAVAINAGDAVYWVNATSNVAAAGDILIGSCQKAALDTDSYVIINFDGAAAFLKL